MSSVIFRRFGQRMPSTITAAIGTLNTPRLAANYSTSKLLDQFNVISTLDTNPRQPTIQKCRADGGFVIGNINLRGGVCILNGGVFLWDCAQHASKLGRQHFALVEMTVPYPELLLIGTGKEMVPLSPDLANLLQSLGIQYETMTSRNACSTFNILVDEDRPVGALLMPLVPFSARQPNHPPSPDNNGDKD